MKLPILITIFLVALPSTAFAQKVELGGFGSYEHYDMTGFPSQGFGLGGRLDFGFNRHLQLELETAYDFKHAQFQFLNGVSNVTVTQSKLGVLHGNLGVKLQSSGGSFFLF